MNIIQANLNMMSRWKLFNQLFEPKTFENDIQKCQQGISILHDLLQKHHELLFFSNEIALALISSAFKFESNLSEEVVFKALAICINLKIDNIIEEFQDYLEIEFSQIGLVFETLMKIFDYRDLKNVGSLFRNPNLDQVLFFDLLAE